MNSLLEYIEQQLASLEVPQQQHQQHIPADGSLRDLMDDNTYKIQVYQWGAWNTILVCPNDKETILKLIDFVATTPTLENSPLRCDDKWPWPARPETEQENPTEPHATWPFPVAEPQLENDVKEEPSAYDKAMEIVRGK